MVELEKRLQILQVLLQHLDVRRHHLLVVSLPFAHLLTRSGEEHGIGEIPPNALQLLLRLCDLLLDTPHVVLDLLHHSRFAIFGNGEQNRNARNAGRHVNLRELRRRGQKLNIESGETMHQFDHSRRRIGRTGIDEEIANTRFVLVLAHVSDELLQRANVVHHVDVTLRVNREFGHYLHFGYEGVVNGSYTERIRCCEVVLVEERNEGGIQNGVDLFRLEGQKGVQL